MKKCLIVVLGLLVFLVGCSTKDKENNSLVEKSLNDGLILSYQTNTSGLESDPYYEINVYADKYITYGYSNLDGFSKIELTDEQYQEIVNYIESDAFLALDSDISNNNDVPKKYERVIIYYNNYTNLSISGTNISDETFLGLVSLLEKYNI